MLCHLQFSEEVWNWQSKQMVQEISVVSMKAAKKVIFRRYYLFPRKHLNFPWNYRIYRTNCKRSRTRTTLSGRRSVAPGKFSTETTQKVVFRLLLPTVFSIFLLFVNDKQPTSPWFPWWPSLNFSTFSWFFPTVVYSTKKWSYRHI